MNIKITYNWLLDYLETDANVYELQQYLSLCGPSIEKVEKIGDDYVLDIEITSNRIDCASVIGIAQEAAAILPRFQKKAQLKNNPLIQLKFPPQIKNHTNNLSLNLIVPTQLCSRFTAIVLNAVDIQPAPDFIRRRLKLCNIKSINNIVDISNYLMLTLGQPNHMFDYEKISQATMIMRQSQPGEIITTLDGKKITLSGNDIIMQDGEGKIFDLCGIMGGLNSAISNTTKTIIFFVQTYNKKLIRQTAMLTNQRTLAATYFEKGLDEERVEPTFVLGLNLLEKYASAKIASPLYDLNYTPQIPTSIHLTTSEVEKIIGVKITENEIKQILENLGFKVNANQVQIPSARKNDVFTKEDLIEEIARIYGYHNLPCRLTPLTYLKQPQEIENNFKIQNKIKLLLKHLGLNEVMNYSMISQKLIKQLDLNLIDHLDVKNTISDEIKYLRLSLLPSLIKNTKDNEGKKNPLRLFEIAKVYHPRQNNLPNEVWKLAIAINTDFADLKGIMHSILTEVGILHYEIAPFADNHFFNHHWQAQIIIGKESIGEIGKLKEKYRQNVDLKSELYLLEFDLATLIKYQKDLLPYQPINPYAVIKLDLTFNAKNIIYSHFTKSAFKLAKLLTKIELINEYQDNLNLRFYFSSKERNITQKEAEEELNKIKSLIA
jgi:phenylalanyl-tRNA synthetase beta chain